MPKEHPQQNRPAVTAFMRAVRDRAPDRVRALLADDSTLVAAHDYDCFGATALIHATGNRDREMVDLLLAHGADLGQRSDWWAGSFGVLPCDDPEMAAFLIDRGAAVDAHTAASLGDAGRLRALLDADPDLVHARGGDGQLPLHYATTPEAVDLLLERGADLAARDIDHESTAAHWQATRTPTIIPHLVERGATPDVFMAARSGDLALLDRLLTANPAEVGARLTKERFPTSDNTPAAHIYIYTIGEGSTPLHAAGPGPRGVETIRLLLEHGADPNARGGYDDGTPLHQAAWNNRVDAADALLAGGAAIDMKSGPIHANEPLGWATVAGAVEMVALLLERGATVRACHIEDAEAGARRAFNWTGAPVANFERIAGLLRGSAG